MDKQVISKELAELLYNKGVIVPSILCYNDEQVINSEVVEKYGELSDDGYYELTEEGGGDLKWDYVYVYETQLLHRSDVWIRRNFYPAPTIDQVINYLYEQHKIFINVSLCSCGFRVSIYENVNRCDDYEFEYNEVMYDAIAYEHPTEAKLVGLEWVIKHMSIL
ncbi:MAG: hypothetical protein IKU29_05215 [Parabacteroides sp.]|nr:hypothetical protein [Parabacteroides sp.]